MDTKLFVRKQSGGMFSIIDKEITTGDIFWVDDSGTDSAGNGQNPDAPFATIDYAIGKCTASQDDIIYVMAGHAENITTATGINCDIAGIKIIGIGEGNLLPTISFTAAAGSITIGAANVTLENLKLVSNFATGVTAGITIAAAGDGCTLRKIKMRETSNANEFLKWISVATTVTDLTIEDCDLHGIIGGTDANAIFFVGSSTDALIQRNTIFGDFSGDVIDHNTTVPVSIRFISNRIINMDADAAGDCISVKTAGTGYAFDNYGFYNKIDATVFTGDAVVWDQNSANNTLASSGIRPHPAAVAAVP